MSRTFGQTLILLLVFLPGALASTGCKPSMTRLAGRAIVHKLRRDEFQRRSRPRLRPARRGRFGAGPRLAPRPVRRHAARTR